MHGGGTYLTEQVRGIIQKYLPVSPRKALAVPLSEVEEQLLKMLAIGYSSTEIGERMCKSPRTIEKYRSELYRKFDVSNKEQLIMAAAKLSMI